MARFIFLLLLLANIAFGLYLYLAETQPAAAPPREINRDALQILSVADPAKAQADALAARKFAESLKGSACVDFSVKPADGTRAGIAFAAMNLGEKMTSRNVEDFSRFVLTLPAQRDKRAAETQLANLKKAGVKDVSLLGDNGISLGVFSSDESARKALADIQSKAGSLAKDVQISPRNPQVKEMLFTLRDPDMNMIARLTILQREFEASSLKAVACPVAAPVLAPAAVGNTQDAKAAPEKAKP